MRSKKGVEMSMHLVVIAALALIILVVLIVLVTKQSGNVDSTINSCENRGPDFRCSSSCSGDETLYSTRGCGEGQVCCTLIS